MYYLRRLFGSVIQGDNYKQEKVGIICITIVLICVLPGVLASDVRDNWIPLLLMLHNRSEVLISNTDSSCHRFFLLF